MVHGMFERLNGMFGPLKYPIKYSIKSLSEDRKWDRAVSFLKSNVPLTSQFSSKFPLAHVLFVAAQRNLRTRADRLPVGWVLNVLKKHGVVT